MRNAREPIWWLPLLRRVLGWGLATSIMTGFLPFLVVAAMFGWIEVGPYQDFSYMAPSRWERVISVATISVLASSPFLLAGLIVGTTTGFYAPATEAKNSLKSKFFRAVVAQTLLSWLFSFGILSQTFYYGFPYFGLGIPITVVLALAIVLFALSLWRAINRALRAVKLK